MNQWAHNVYFRLCRLWKEIVADDVELSVIDSRLRLKCDGTQAEIRFCLSAKRTTPFKSAPGGGGGRQFSRLLAAEMCASAVVMLDTPCSGVV